MSRARDAPDRDVSRLISLPTRAFESGAIDSRIRSFAPHGVGERRLARPAGLEPATPGLEGLVSRMWFAPSYSIPLYPMEAIAFLGIQARRLRKDDLYYLDI